MVHNREPLAKLQCKENRMVLMAMPSAENGCAGTGQQLEVLRSLLVFPSFFPVLSPFLPFFPLVESVKMHYVDNNDVSEIM